MSNRVGVHRLDAECPEFAGVFVDGRDWRGMLHPRDHGLHMAPPARAVRAAVTTSRATRDDWRDRATHHGCGPRDESVCVPARKTGERVSNLS